MNAGHPLDLVLLVPGADERETFGTLLSERPQSLGIRPLKVELLKHPRRDPGCFHEAHSLLQPYVTQASRALVVFDRQGSGQENSAPHEIAAELRSRLAASGWEDRAAVVVLDPELEVWVWSSSPHVPQILGWQNQRLAVRDWLEEQGFWPQSATKPNRPKEALERVLRVTRVRRSAALYARLASLVGLATCTEPSFDQFRNVLRAWFPAER